MNGRYTALLVVASAGVFALTERPALALPTMIRLGYPTCASCHISPQGGGLLNLYGRSIDQAQSLIGGEYSPWEAPFVRFLNGEGRITQDLRSVLQQQDVSTHGKAGTQVFRSRFLYRNATELGNGFRFTATITGQNQNALRPALAYDPPSNSAQLFVNTALLSYRAKPSLEFAVGRDQFSHGAQDPRSVGVHSCAESVGILRCSHPGESILVDQTVLNQPVRLRSRGQ